MSAQDFPAVAFGTMKKARSRGPLFVPLPRLHGPDVGRLLALGAGRDVEGHLLVFLQALEARALDRREMREKVLAAAVRRDESVALRIVEPLDGSCCHGVTAFQEK